ncbi:unannotated protein [freshwater metagenome]|uniref:Unannotated protein n=1 Tax=freshwater metagenome TaxID=449393 RepID=A0A6J6ICP8_9ZZZZ
MHIVKSEGWVVAQQVAGERAHFGERFDTGESATDNYKGEQTVALGTGRHVGSLVEVNEDAVAHLCRLFDIL